MPLIKIVALLFTTLLCLVPLTNTVRANTVQANKSNSSLQPLDAITLQLKWKHQFQFAGYYAAIEKGFYAEEGLDVSLIEYQFTKDNIEQVTSGAADYGISDSTLYVAATNKKPIVLLAQIFQRSPLIVFSRSDFNITDVNDLKNKTLALASTTGTAAIEAMIINELGSMEAIKRVPYGKSTIQDLIDKKIDASMGYLSNQPYQLIKQNINFNVIKPQNYGIDFYGDNLFTSLKELENNPRRVKKMLKATLKGWQYALNHQDEIINLILEKYDPSADPEKLKYEARYVREMILPNLFRLGYVDENRIKGIIETYKELNYIDNTQLPRSFLYQVNQSQKELILTAEEEAWITANPNIIYGAETDWPPFDYTNAEGEHVGIARDFLDLISELTGITFTPEIADWHTTLQKAIAGDIKLLPALAFTEERSKRLVYSQYYSANTPYFFANIEALPQTNKTAYFDASNKVVAVVKSYGYIDTLKRNYPSITTLEANTLRESISNLIEGRADLLVGSHSAVSYQLNRLSLSTIKPIKQLDSNSLDGIYMATNKDNAMLISIINKALDVIPSTKKQDIIKYWLGEAALKEASKRIQLTPTEQKWLLSNKKIRYAGDPNWLPFEGFDSKGRYTGMVSDYLDIIETNLGIDIEIVKTKTWQETLEKFMAGELDMISETIDSSLTRKHSFTNGYLSNPVVIISQDKTGYIDSLSEITTQSVGIIKNYGYVSRIKSDHPDLNYMEVDNVDEGLLALSTGKLDFFICAVGSATYQIAEQGYNNVRIVGKTGYDSTLGFLVNSKYDQLIPILNKAINNITSKQHKTIKDAWGKDKFTTRVDYSLLWKVLSAVAIATILAWLWIRSLSKEVTKRKESENELQVANSRFSLAAEAASLGLWQFLVPLDKTRTPSVIIDDRTYKLYDFQPHETADWNTWLTRVHEKDRDSVRNQILELAYSRSDEPLQGEFRVFLPSGEMRYIYSALMVEGSSENKKHINLVGVSWDITEEKRTQTSLLKAKIDADNANQAKSEFLSNMSHEIRTPMNSIIGFTELLDERTEDHNSKAFIKTIRSAGKSLLSIINDILDLSKIEAGKLEIIKEPTDIHALMDDISNIFMMRVREKNLDLIVEVSPDIPSSLLVDETRLRQVLFNLIGNAVKFTEEGYIRIRAESENEDEIRSKLDLVVHIQDTGIGIPENERGKIFNAFEQLSGQSVKKYGGTGLGLPISLRLANMMGGEVVLESKLGEGSLFSVRLKGVDISAFEHAKQENNEIDYQSIDFKPCRILIVDDVEDNRNLLISNFEQKGIATECACNGLEAVERAKQVQFDLILMDIRMPIMNGYDAAENIRSFSNTPIVALTASVMADDFERQKRDLFNGFLRKPVLRADLFNELTKFIEYEVNEDEHEEEHSTSYTFSTDELSHIGPYFNQYQALAAKAENLENSNNIKDITTFNNDLSELLSNCPITILLKLNQELADDLGSFNITGIKNAINEFPRIVLSLKKNI